jgi:hypothetical protein
MTGRLPEDGVPDEAQPKDGCLGLADLDSLAALARSSEDHEAYRAVAMSERFRIGLVANACPNTPVVFRIEVLLQILAKDTRPEVADLGRVNEVLETIAKRGYSLDHHDSCWILCEREVDVDDIEEECRAVVEIIQSPKSEKSCMNGDMREGIRPKEV